MSLFSSINTAVSGLNAQSANFGNISEDVANSQTTGFKRVDTSFVDYLTTSTPAENLPGSVVARPDYINNVQGPVTQTDNPLGMAIAGNGFFKVSQSTGSVNNKPTFDPQEYYTRAGDFTMNKQGYLVNSAGQFLNAWSVDPKTSVVNRNALGPVQVDQSNFKPVATSNVSLSANLPATPTAGTGTAGNPTATPPVPASPIISQVTIYDALGTAHAVNLNWTQNVDSTTNLPITGDWNCQITVPDAVPQSGVAATDAGTAEVKFGALSGNFLADGTTTVPEGTIGSIDPSTSDAGTVAPASYTAGGPATLTFATDFGSGSQQITLNLGTFGGTSGITQYAGTAYNPLGVTQDGVPPGSFTGVTTQPNGDIVASYNNGQNRTIAQIPLVSFNDPNALQGQNGQSFTATNDSGTPTINAVGSNGAGTLVVGSTEGSNVDISKEFSNLIVAQQAYSSNAKVVTTATQMLQATLQMISG